jgi:hypothetical protein
MENKIVSGHYYKNRHTGDLYEVLRVSDKVEYKMVGVCIFVYKALSEVFLQNFIYYNP